MQGFGFKQQQVQKQIQVLSQKQILSLSTLSLSSQDLFEKVEKEASENPAFTLHRISPDDTRISKSTGAAAQERSDNFQAVLEAKADTRESLSHHLLTQLHSLDLTESETAFGEQVVWHLDKHGFLLFDPLSLLDKKDSHQTPSLAKKILNILQNLDPVGTCTKDFRESLLVQAKFSAQKNELALFILDGHFDFLNPPVPSLIQKKISAYLLEQKKLFSLKEKITSLDISTESIEKALLFIKKLDPYPGTNYSTETTGFVEPDIYIEKIDGESEFEDFEQGIVKTQNSTFRIRTAWQKNYRVEINPEYKLLSKNKKLSKEDAKKFADSVKNAQDLIDSIEFRQNTLLRAMCLIVKKQSAFFEKGEGNLVPLKQKELAELLDVHETTVSRIANGKYVQCDQGFFSIKHFFTNAVKNVSRDRILYEIKSIIEEHKSDSERLSDIKLCALLEKKGIKIARRTVAKYRGLLSIESSFRR